VIEVRIEELGAMPADAILRPVSADWNAVTPLMRRLEIAAGEKLAEQCSRLGELPVGSASITGAGELPAEFMVHVVVRAREEPVSAGGVARGLQNGLRRLAEWKLSRVAMPLLGTGAGNLDADEAAALMLGVLQDHMSKSEYPSQVIIAVEREYEKEAFDRELRRLAEFDAALIRPSPLDSESARG
jgi:O-acetyl-ADP-ribose deacetylase (regulator of RNase III)